VQRRILSAVEIVQFVSDRVSYIVLRKHWFNVFVLNVYAPSEEKSDDANDSSYKVLELFFILFRIPHENSIRRF